MCACMCVVVCVSSTYMSLLKGAECKHNLAYWRGQEYLGIGPGRPVMVVGSTLCERLHSMFHVFIFLLYPPSPWSV